MDDEPMAYVVLRGEDESTSCVLYVEDLVMLKHALSKDPLCKETKDRLARLFEMLDKR